MIFIFVEFYFNANKYEIVSSCIIEIILCSGIEILL